MPLQAPANPEMDAVGPAGNGLPRQAQGERLPVPREPSSTWRTAWQLMAYAISVDPAGFCVTVAVALAGSLAEGAGLVLLLPLLSVAGMNFTGSSLAIRLSAIAQRVLEAGRVPHWLWLPAVLAVFLAVAGVRSVLRRAQSTLVYGSSTRVELALSRRVYESVVRAQWSFLVRQRAGRLTHLLTAELKQVAEAVYLGLALINLLCLTVLYLGLALRLSASMTLLVLAIGGALILVQRGSLARLRTTSYELARSVGEVYAATEEHLLNLKSVKTCNAEERDVKLFGELCDQVAHHTVENARHQAASAFRFELGSLLALGAVIYLALGVLHVEAATMLLLLGIFTRLMPQLSSLQGQTQQVASALPAYERVLAIEAECRGHAEPELAAPESAPESTPAVPSGLTRELRVEDLWFAYGAAAQDDSAPQHVLRGVDLFLEAGKMTAIVGPSGAGKSTLADLANGLLLPTRGRLLVDGIPLGPAVMRQWRRQVGYVGQDTVLFHQSVRANLLWASPHATEEQMREALLLASAEFVYDLPGGLESVVGDRGILLSSGQRQRIALARALLRRPTLLLLDEATNALDVENEARVLDALREAMRKREGRLTILMIAHRASAVRKADRVFELEGGRVAGSQIRDESQAGARP